MRYNRLKRILLVIAVCVFVSGIRITAFAFPAFVTKQEYGITKYYIDEEEVTEEEYFLAFHNELGQNSLDSKQVIDELTAKEEGYTEISENILENVLTDYFENADGSSLAFFYKSNEVGTILKLYEQLIKETLFQSYKQYYFNEITMQTVNYGEYIAVRLDSAILESVKMSASEETELNAKVSEIVNKYNYGSDYDKIKNVYDYFCTNISYDPTYRKRTPYDALIGGKSVCEGYATAYQMIMEAFGIESYMMLGMQTASTVHAWNIVRLDSNYYYVDTTWGSDYSEQSVDYSFLLSGTDFHAPKKQPYDIPETLPMADMRYYAVDVSTRAETSEQSEAVTSEGQDLKDSNDDRNAGIIIIAVSVILAAGAGVTGRVFYLKRKK